MPRFSVITITRNNLDGLKRTQDSLTAQSFQEYEWIIIDGASTDGTPEFLETTNAQFVSEPDTGIYDAMNKGLVRATGDYLLFLNAGDILADPEILNDAFALAGDLIYGDGREGNFVKRARSHETLIWGMFTYHQAMFYRRAALGDLRYDTDYRIAADYKFTAAFLRGGAVAFYWPRVICEYEPGGLSQTMAAAGRRELADARAELKIGNTILNEMVVWAQAIVWRVRCLAPGLYKAVRGTAGKILRKITQARG